MFTTKQWLDDSGFADLFFSKGNGPVSKWNMRGAEPPLSLPEILQNVLLKRVALKDVVAKLGSDEFKTLAYEMGIYICDADGLVNAQEQAFLTNLKDELHVGSDEAEKINARGAALATIPVKDRDEALPAAASEAEIGKVAYLYYSGGRKLDTAQLKTLFHRFSDESKALYNRYQGDIQQKARSVNVNDLIPMIRGNQIL